MVVREGGGDVNKESGTDWGTLKWTFITTWFEQKWNVKSSATVILILARTEPGSRIVWRCSVEGHLNPGIPMWWPGEKLAVMGILNGERKGVRPQVQPTYIGLILSDTVTIKYMIHNRWASCMHYKCDAFWEPFHFFKLYKRSKRMYMMSAVKKQ